MKPGIAIGRWRDDAADPMQVVSGRADAPTVNFQAPDAARIDAEIDAFLIRFEASPEEDGLLRSAIAHFWFVTIHPFDDGNGRIARAVADLALARDERSIHRYFSMSRQINLDKSSYYRILERTQRGNSDITEWLAWLLDRDARAIRAARESIDEALRAQRFGAPAPAFRSPTGNVAFSRGTSTASKAILRRTSGVV